MNQHRSFLLPKSNYLCIIRTTVHILLCLSTNLLFSTTDMPYYSSLSRACTRKLFDAIVQFARVISFCLFSLISSPSSCSSQSHIHRNTFLLLACFSLTKCSYVYFCLICIDFSIRKDVRRSMFSLYIYIDIEDIVSKSISGGGLKMICSNVVIEMNSSMT